MRLEIYPQYTKGWVTVKIDSDNLKYDMIEWCRSSESNSAYHICYNNQKFEENGHLTIKSDVEAIKFQSCEDAMMFSMLWG